VEMDQRQPILQKGEAENIALPPDEPLRLECEHFLKCVRERTPPLTDAAAGIRVLKVLQACQISLQLNGRPVLLSEIQ
jgi:predicted dehydrogenase